MTIFTYNMRSRALSLTAVLFCIDPDLPGVGSHCKCLYDFLLNTPITIMLLFPFFIGRNTYQDGVNFIRDKFVRLNRNPGRKTVYTHVTCATDTSNIQFVFESVTDIIIAEHLRETGLF